MLEWRCFAKPRLRVLQCFLVSSFTCTMLFIFITGPRKVPKSSPKFIHVNVVFLLTLFLSHKSDLTQIITTTLTLLKPSSILPENSCVLRRMVDHGNNGVAAPNVEVPSLLEEGHMIPFLCHPGRKVRA